MRTVLSFQETVLPKAKLSTTTGELRRFMIPHVRKRRLTMERFQPDIDARPVFQKDMPEHFPDWIPRIEVPKHGGTVTHVVCDNAETLVYIANQGCLTPHVGLQRIDKNEFPDQMIFDLDPPSDDFGIVRTVAFKMRELLDEHGLTPFLKTTGSRGLHLVIPLDRKLPFDDVRAIARNDRGRDGPARTEPRHDRDAQEKPRRQAFPGCESQRDGADRGTSVRGPRQGWRTGRDADHVGGTRRREAQRSLVEYPECVRADG